MKRADESVSNGFEVTRTSEKNNEERRKNNVGRKYVRKDHGKLNVREGMVLKGLAVFMVAMLLSGCQKPLKKSMAERSSLSAAEVKAETGRR